MTFFSSQNKVTVVTKCLLEYILIGDMTFANFVHKLGMTAILTFSCMTADRVIRFFD